MERDVYERFVRKIAAGDAGCWIWTACTNRQGYGELKNAGGSKLAHRVSYQHFVGAIPLGYELHHICENPRCVRPDHLRAVTRLEHARLGPQATKTHCKRGHELSPDNLIAGRPWRTCKRCHRERMATVRRGHVWV